MGGGEDAAGESAAHGEAAGPAGQEGGSTGEEGREEAGGGGEEGSQGAEEAPPRSGPLPEGWKLLKREEEEAEWSCIRCHYASDRVLVNMKLDKHYGNLRKEDLLLCSSCCEEVGIA